MKVYEYILRIKDQATDKIRRFANSVNSADRNTRRFSGSVDKASSRMVTMGDVTSGLARWIGPAVLGAALTAGAYKASALAREFEQTQISFEVMMGSVQKGRALLSDIIDLGSVTPFTSRDLQKSGKLLLGYGIAGEKIIPTLRMLGDISGGNADRLHLLSLAYSQTQAAGRLMGQDLLQMVNSGFNPLKVISEKTGISIGRLKEKMEDGAISAKMVEAAFKAATDKGGQFFNMMERQSQTFEGRLSTLQDKIEIWATGAGQSINTLLSPMLDAAISKLDKLIDKTGSLTNENNKERDSFKHLNNEVKPLLEQYFNLKSRMVKTKEEQAKMNMLTQKLSAELPGAVTKFDRYGNVLQFNTQKARELIDQQEKLFLLKNDEAQKGILEKITQLKDESAKVQGLMVALQNQPDNNVNKSNSQGLALLKTNSEEMLKLETQLAHLRGDRVKAFLKDSAPVEGPKKDPFADLKAAVKKEDEDGLNKITGGGRQAVNVTINIDRLNGIENVESISAEGNGGLQNLKEIIAKYSIEAVLRAVNSANIAASQ